MLPSGKVCGCGTALKNSLNESAETRDAALLSVFFSFRGGRRFIALTKAAGRASRASSSVGQPISSRCFSQETQDVGISEDESSDVGEGDPPTVGDGPGVFDATADTVADGPAVIVLIGPLAGSQIPFWSVNAKAAHTNHVTAATRAWPISRHSLVFITLVTQPHVKPSRNLLATRSL